VNQPNTHPPTIATQLTQRLGKLTLGLIGLSLLALPTPAIAQEYAGCFWIDDRGKRIDLSEFCPQPIPVETNEIGSRSPNAPGTTPDSISVPILRREAGVPVVSVLFNGRPYDMLVDTGASVIVLPGRMGRELGLQSSGSMFVTTASASRVEFGVAQVASVQLGSLVMNNLDVAIARDDTLEMGLLGQNFFSSYDLTLRQDTIEFSHRTNP
jgi:aspartyl protease family protein